MKNKGISLYDALIKAGASVEEDQKAFLNALDEALKARQADTDESMSESLKTAIAEAVGALEKDQDGNVIPMATKLKDIAESLEKLEKRQIVEISNKEKYQLKKWVKENHKEIVKTMKEGRELEFNFTAIKAAAAFTTTSAVTNDTGVVYPTVENILVEDGIIPIRYPANFIPDAIPSRQVDKVPAIDYLLEQATEEGAVAVVAEGGTKPLVSETFVRTATDRVKVAAHIEWSEEFEMDNEKLFNEILRLFESKVIRKWNAEVLDVIETNATAYTSSTMDGTLTLPDNALAVIAAQSVIQGMNYTPDIVLMNPADIFVALFTQDTEGNPRMLPYLTIDNNGNARINGMRVISNNNIAQGSALVGESSVYQEWHSGFILRFGTYNDQFIKNMKAAVGEVFFLARIAQNDLPAWMVLDLDAVKADLEIVTP